MQEKTNRNQAIRSIWSERYKTDHKPITMSDLAGQFGLTRARIHQIINKKTNETSTIQS